MSTRRTDVRLPKVKYFFSPPSAILWLHVSYSSGVRSFGKLLNHVIKMNKFYLVNVNNLMHVNNFLY